MKLGSDLLRLFKFVYVVDWFSHWSHGPIKNRLYGAYEKLLFIKITCLQFTFLWKLYFTVLNGTKLDWTVQYITIIVIFSSEMSCMAPKTMETTYNTHVVNSFEKKFVCTYYGTKLCSTVQYIKQRHFEFRNELLDPKNHGKDILHAYT